MKEISARACDGSRDGLLLADQCRHHLRHGRAECPREQQASPGAPRARCTGAMKILKTR